ncbi:MAG: hypothetical protein RJQ08_04950 [Salinisphaeraceae bacterium]
MKFATLKGVGAFLVAALPVIGLVTFAISARTLADSVVATGGLPLLAYGTYFFTASLAQSQSQYLAARYQGGTQQPFVTAAFRHLVYSLARVGLLVAAIAAAWLWGTYGPGFMGNGLDEFRGSEAGFQLDNEIGAAAMSIALLMLASTLAGDTGFGRWLNESPSCLKWRTAFADSVARSRPGRLKRALVALSGVLAVGVITLLSPWTGLATALVTLTAQAVSRTRREPGL